MKSRPNGLTKALFRDDSVNKTHRENKKSGPNRAQALNISSSLSRLPLFAHSLDFTAPLKFRHETHFKLI